MKKIDFVNTSRRPAYPSPPNRYGRHLHIWQKAIRTGGAIGGVHLELSSKCVHRIRDYNQMFRDRRVDFGEIICAHAHANADEKYSKSSGDGMWHRASTKT